MTSKEKIREILATYHEYVKYYDEDDEWEKINFNYDGKTFRIFEEDVEKVKEIIKDLEVLEILKKHCDFSLWDDDLNILAKEEYSTDYESGQYTSVNIPDEEDRETIEEWLDDK